MDKELHSFIDKGIWEKQSDKMVAFLPAESITAFLRLLGDKHPGTVQIPKHQMTQVDTQVSGDGTVRRHYVVRLPEPAPLEPLQIQQAKVLSNEGAEIRIRALALELEMEMEMDMASSPALAGISPVRLNHNISRNGVEVKFDTFPEYSIKTFLSNKGFRYSSRQALWYATYSEKLFAEVSDKLIASGFSVNGEGGDGNGEAVVAAKQRIADEAAAKGAIRLAEYMHSHAKNYELAKMLFPDFILSFSCPATIEIGSRIYTYDGIKKDYTFLPQGRKRPDRYSLAQVHEYLMREALNAGAVIPLESYYSNPANQHREAGFHLSHLNMLIKQSPQMANAPDYMGYRALLEDRKKAEDADSERWGEYRAKVFGPLTEKKQRVWVKDEKGVWAEYRISSKNADALRAERAYVRYDTIELQRNRGYIIVGGNHLISRVHPSQNSPSFLELYPIEQVLGSGNGTQAIPPALADTTLLKVTALALELEMEMENEMG